MHLFKGLEDFAHFNKTKAIVADVELAIGVRAMAENYHKVAFNIFGNEEKLAPELSKYTQERREELGFSPDETFVRTGALRDSLEMKSFGTIAGVGTNDERMVYLNNGFVNARTGTSVPPRPLFQIALHESAATNAAIILKTTASMIGVTSFRFL